MLAPAEQTARVAEEPQRAEIVVGVHGSPSADASDTIRAGHRIGRQLGAAYPGRRTVVLLLTDGAAEHAPPVPADPLEPYPEVPLLSWSHPGQSAVEAMLRAAESFEAAACALVMAEGDGAPPEAAHHLVRPVLDDGIDLACPWYASQRYEGVLTTGLVYPLTRALYGKRLRQPLGHELALSRRAVAHLLGEAWHTDPARAGERLWLVTSLLAGDFQVAQACLESRPPRLADAGADLAASLAQVVGLLFHEARLHAPSWQRHKASRPVRTYGEPASQPGEPGQPQIGPMIAAFQLGYQELQQLWGAVLPPQTLLALKRLARAPEESFSLDDALWARVVYDFAVGYHLATMDRALLLRSMTPLYLAWAAGFVREVRELSTAAVEERCERLCRAFEVAKPYLISRWRWPDRFNP
ncbi:MAG TPA: hypothetical protein VF400_16340 [Anaeromyxobacteraceae bacterium]